MRARRLIEVAKEHGTLVAMSCGDAGVVQRHRSDFRDALAMGVDLLFANENEAHALVGDGRSCSTEDVARLLGSLCPLAVVTDGSRGSYIINQGQLSVIPPCWLTSPPVDTCGAGDAYAAGILYGLLNGNDVTSMGQAAARVASAVICKHGPQLSSEDAQQLVKQLQGAAGRSHEAPVAACEEAPADLMDDLQQQMSLSLSA